MNIEERISCSYLGESCRWDMDSRRSSWLQANEKCDTCIVKPPDNVQDSGWRFFSGDESDEYVNDPDNIGLYDVNTIADIDPDIIPYLSHPVGSAFEREDGALPFVKSP